MHYTRSVWSRCTDIYLQLAESKNKKNVTFLLQVNIKQYIIITENKKLSYRRGTARCVVSVKILPIATQQCRNYLYDKIVL